MTVTKPRLPILNKVQPQASRMLACWPMYEGGGSSIHDISGYRHHGTLTSSGDWKTTTLGRSLYFDGSFYAQTGQWLPNLTTGGLSIILWCQTPHSGYTRMFNIHNGSAGRDYIAVANGNGGANGDATIEYRTGSTFRRNALDSIDDNEMHNVAVSFDLDAGVLHGWLDGIEELTYSNSDISNGFYFGDEDSSIVIGAEAAGGYKYVGYLPFVMLTRRVLTDSDVKWMHANPYQMFLPNQCSPTLVATVAATTVGTTTIRLTWQDNAENEEGFSIERQTDGGGWSEIDTPAVNAETYDDTGVSVGHTYEYRIKATSATLGDSEWSNIAEVTV